MEAGEIRQRLDELAQCLKDTALVEATKVSACRFDGLIADEIKRVAVGLRKGLQMKPPVKRHAQQALKDLLCELRPHSGERRCRPYELFLFAAQQRLLQDKLIRKRFDLKPDFIPNPAYPLPSTPILESHRGADIAMGLDDSV